MPMTPGLMGNIRQPAPEEGAIPLGGDTIIEIMDDGQDNPTIDKDGAILEIQHADGSLTISLDGKPINDNRQERDETDWYRNLVDDVSEGVLNGISQDLLRGIRDDISSRNDWIEDRAQGIKLLGPGLRSPACRVRLMALR
jgi:hypothetical protein